MRLTIPAGASWAAIGYSRFRPEARITMLLVHSKVVAIVFGALAAIGLSSAVNAAFLSVQTACSLQSFIAGNVHCVSVNADTTQGYLPNALVTASDTFRSERALTQLGQINAWNVSGSATSIGRSNYGNLGVLAETSISGFVQVTGFETAATALTGFSDLVRVITGGSPGSITVSGFIDVALSGEANGTSPVVVSNSHNMRIELHVGAVEYDAETPCSGCGNPDPDTIVSGRNFFSFVVPVTDGEVLDVHGSMYGNTVSSLSTLPFVGANGNGDVHTFLQSLNSAHIFLDPSPGVTLIADSGHNYATPTPNNSVPEPGTIALLLAALVGLSRTFLRRRG